MPKLASSRVSRHNSPMILDEIYDEVCTQAGTETASTTPCSFETYLWSEAPGDFSSHGAICRNEPVTSYDAFGLWGEGGHYYTVMIVAYAAGYSFEDAAELAFFAELPDEVWEYGALATPSGSKWTSLNLGVFRGLSLGFAPITKQETLIQRMGHGLMGKLAGPVRDAFRTELLPELNRLSDKGVMLHTFGDLYAHSFVQGGEDVLYPPVAGHAGTSIESSLGISSDPDRIGSHYEQYKKYVNDMYQVLKNDNKGTPRPQILSRLIERTSNLQLEPLNISAENERMGQQAMDLVPEYLPAILKANQYYFPERYKAKMYSDFMTFFPGKMGGVPPEVIGRPDYYDLLDRMQSTMEAYLDLLILSK